MRNPFEGHPYRGGASEQEKAEMKSREHKANVERQLYSIFARVGVHRWPADSFTPEQTELAKIFRRNLEIESTDGVEYPVFDMDSLMKDLRLWKKDIEKLIGAHPREDWVMFGRNVNIA